MPVLEKAVDVFKKRIVEVMIAQDGEYTPTPALSHAILVYNRARKIGLADGIVVTPSHNPPEDGDFKYNPPNGGPADTGITGWNKCASPEQLESKGADVITERMKGST